MFFRRWWNRWREAIVRQWIDDHTLPPPPVPKLKIDPAVLEAWRQARAPAHPLDPLHVDTDDLAAKVQALWEWQARLGPWLGDRLKGHDEHLSFLECHRIRVARQLYPFEYVLDSLICAHPRPDVLLRIWNQHVPLPIEDVSEIPDGLTERQKEEALAWQALVRHFTQLIEQAAAYYEKHNRWDDD
jgi:hypothetical protein